MTNQNYRHPLSRNTFDGFKHHKVGTWKFGQMIPSLLVETLPGDKWTIQANIYLKLATLINPVFQSFKVRYDFFQCVNRHVWDEFDEFIQRKSTPAHPYITDLGSLGAGDLGHYMGIPLNIGDATRQFNALPLAHYAQIFDEYYAQSQLFTERFLKLTAGNNSAYRSDALGPPYYKLWDPDYFTSALPSPQKGDAVTLPLIAEQSDLDVEYRTGVGNNGLFRFQINDALATGTASGLTKDSGAQLKTDLGADLFYDPNGTLSVDVDASAATIADLRLAYRLQEYLERLNRAGDRYTEYLEVIWGEKPKDLRLQRPKFLGRHEQNFTIQEVLSTADTSDNENGVNVGYRAGHANSVSGSSRISARCDEHGFLIGILHVVPEVGHSNVTPKHWFKSSDTDYYVPALAHIGDEEILMKEIYPEATSTTGNDTFGYQSRYAYYRFAFNQTFGEMSKGENKNNWHCMREYGFAPALNEAWLQVNPTNDGIARIFADVSGTDDHIYGVIYNNLTVSRKVAKYGTPMG